MTPVVELLYVAFILLPACARFIALNVYCHLDSWGRSPSNPW